MYRPVPSTTDDGSEAESSPSADEQTLKERRPTVVNTGELLQLMETTRESRRFWVETRLPTATEILQRFPRFMDLENSVSILKLSCHITRCNFLYQCSISCGLSHSYSCNFNF